MKNTLLIILFAFSLFACNNDRNIVEPVVEEPIIWPAKMILNDSLDIVLPFSIELKRQNGVSLLYLVNADERIALGAVDLNDKIIEFDMAVFESKMSLVKDGDKLVGEWIKYQTRKTPVEISMTPGPRFERKSEAVGSLNGNYELHFSNNTENHYPAIGKFKTENGKLTGTILTETGDYRYLEGIIEGNQFQLSTFDGAHAFLFTGDIIGDSLNATFYSGSSWQEPFSGKLNPQFELQSASSLTFLKDGYDKFDFTALQLNGTNYTLSEDYKADAPVLIQVLGTWCPNCMDETKLLVELMDKNPKLNVIGLAYERSLDSLISFPNIRKMKTDLNVDYPILLAGTWSKSEAAKTLPMLNKIISYPTLIMLNSDRTVQYIHTGFSGPGTGEDYLKLKKELIEQIASLR